MASINSLMGSSGTGSIYSNPNAITGLASGLDTESMIEQAVSSYENKIKKLQQEQTQVEWQQSAYRDIINKIALFSDKYTTYSSDTNLLSSSFFSNAVNTEALGTYANLVSASGKGTSAISLLGVQQLAKAATYSVGGSASGSFSAAQSVNLAGDITQSAITGSLKLKYGDQSVTLNFTEEDLKNEDGTFISDATGLANLINKKLAEEEITMSSGDTDVVSEYVVAEVNADGQLVLNTTDKAGSGVSISSASGDFKNLLMEEQDGEGNTVYSTTLNTNGVPLTRNVTVAEAIDGQELSVTLNGETKSITLSGNNFLTDLNTKLQNAFGNNVTASLDDDGKLTFKAAGNSALSVSGSALTALGFSDNSQTSYTDTSDTLGALMTGGKENYTITVNGQDFTFGKDATLKDVMNEINKNEAAGVTVSFSTLTSKFVFTSKETGSASKIDISGDLTMFNTNGAIKGQDAKLAVKVNGSDDVMYLTRSSNTIDMDGMKVTLKGTFGDFANDALVDETAAKKEAVTFNSGADTEKITDAVKDMVKDYNELVELIKNSYKTKPLTNSKGDRYKPLTEDDRADMSESEIKAYEEKAKTGLLFGDSDLSAMYNKLVSAISSNVIALEKIGVTTNFTNGLTTLKLDEKKLGEALKSDPDSVQEAFSGTDGKSGFMGAIDKVMDQYGATTGANKGVLLQKAGSPLAPTTVNNNTLQSKIAEYEKLIDKWQDKLADKIDYYSRQFSMLEKMMAEMNSQSSSLSGLMGGY